MELPPNEQSMTPWESGPVLLGSPFVSHPFFPNIRDITAVTLKLLRELSARLVGSTGVLVPVLTSSSFAVTVVHSWCYRATVLAGAGAWLLVPVGTWVLVLD